MSLQAVTKTNLAVKARTRDQIGVSSQNLNTTKRIATFLMSSDQSQDIAKTFVQPQPASTKLPIACARDLPDGRFVETYRLRIGERRLCSFRRSPEIKYRPLGRLRSLIVISQRRGEFVEPAGKQRFDRFGGKLMQFLAPSEKHRVVSDIMRDGVLEDILALFQPGRF